MSEIRRNQVAATVVANTSPCRDHFRLVLRMASFPPTAPGQFVQVSCRDLAAEYSPEHQLEWEPGWPVEVIGPELLSPLAMLRRPFSLAGRRDVAGGVEIEIIQRVVGVGTQWLSRLKPGTAVYLLGPLGNRFELPPEDGVGILVGGGVGIPPMIYLASKMAGRKAVAFCGSLTRDLLPLTVTADALAPKADAIDPLYNIAEFAAYGVPAVISTDDGSYGFHGFVTQALERYLDKWFTGKEAAARAVVYTCGPEGMMKRVSEIAAARGIQCQVAVERAMACGMGTCQSCVIKVKQPNPNGEKPWVYKLACTDGPVFRGTDLLW